MFRTPPPKKRRTKERRGFALISAATLMAVVMAFGAILINYLVSVRRTANRYETTVYVNDISEAGITKAIFCLNAKDGSNCGGVFGNDYDGESDIPFGGGKFTTVISGTGTTRTITSTGTTDKGQSKVIAVEATSLPLTDEDLSFGYALQAGNHGIYFANNAGLTGTIYSNGDIVCNSISAVIDGDAFNSKTGGKIDSCHVKYYAHADKILNSKVGLDAYYKQDPADIAGSTVGGAKHAYSSTPQPTDMPIMDIDFWRQAAETGGTINGNYSPADNSHLGPVKIIGNLTLGQNVDVVVDGPIWVVGDISTQNNSSLSLASSFGAFSTVILADDPDDRPNRGKIHIINGTDINGSGSPTSHILIAATNTSISDAAPAMLVENNAAGAIFYALNGTLRLSNLGSAKAMSAARIYLDENAHVTYLESEMSDQKFSNSPGGVWRITEGSWREAR